MERVWLFGRMHALVSRLRAGGDLDGPALVAAAHDLASENVGTEIKADFLRAFREKGETAEEIAAFAEALLALAVDPGMDAAALPGPAVDVCGTGGDRLGYFNISTGAMFVAAGAGACVIKHGNRGITSRCGGADVLEALGVPVDLPPERARACAERDGLAFLFAPAYHLAFKAIAPARKALAEEGIPTVFNILGPLLNPARPAFQLVGIYDRARMETYARILARIGRKRAWVVHGGGADELVTTGRSEVRDSAMGGAFEIDPAALGFAKPEPAALVGGDRETNARILMEILEGRDRGPRRDIVVLNAAAALVVAGIAPDLAAARALAEESLDRGAALAKLEALRGA